LQNHQYFADFFNPVFFEQPHFVGIARSIYPIQDFFDGLLWHCHIAYFYALVIDRVHTAIAVYLIA